MPRVRSGELVAAILDAVEQFFALRFNREDIALETPASGMEDEAAAAFAFQED